MIARRENRGLECVVVDLNTQRDFCESGGAHPVSNLDTLLPALRRVVAWAKRNHAPVISSLDSHRQWEVTGDGYPAHCIDGSLGQRKLDFTVFPCRIRVEADNTLAVPNDLFRYYQQVIFPKRTDDLLANPKADRLLTQLCAHEFVLFGTGVENAVKALALGLIARGKAVTIISDACGYWSGALAELALRQLVAKGASVISVEELLHRKLSRRQRYPSSVVRLNGHVHRNGKGHSTGTNGQSKNGHSSRLSPANVDARIASSEEDIDGIPGPGDPGI